MVHIGSSKILLILSFIILGYCPTNQANNITPITIYDFSCLYKNEFFYAILRTRPFFHLSRYLSQLKNGSLFTCHQITSNQSKDQNELTDEAIYIEYDASGNIQAINDGKKSPLLLGSIPSQESHILKIKETANCPSDGIVEIITMNEQWEIETAGLSKLVKNYQQIKQFNYPTPDFTCPSLKDIIYAVHTLETRNLRHAQACLVHCKAGRSRSATAVAAYLIHIMLKAEQNVSIDEIIAYLTSRRPEVHLGKSQKNMLNLFYQELQKSGSLEALYQNYITQ